MAKKKSSSAPISKAPVKNKTKARRSAAVTRSKSKTGTAKRAKSTSKPAKTVDSILKRFDKERVAKNSALVTTRKKIERMTKQISSMKEELESLKKTAVETEVAIETLDSRRDSEVGQLLSGMGIDLAAAAAASKPKAKVEKCTPLFDQTRDSDSEGNDSESKSD